MVDIDQFDVVFKLIYGSLLQYQQFLDTQDSGSLLKLVTSAIGSYIDTACKDGEIP